jgi:hypothetical protein
MRLLAPTLSSVCAPRISRRSRRSPARCAVLRRGCVVRADGTALGETQGDATAAWKEGGNGTGQTGLPRRAGWSDSTLAIHGGACLWPDRQPSHR